MSNPVSCQSLFTKIPDHLVRFFEKADYPWQLLEGLNDMIAALLAEGIEGYTLLKEGVLVGKNVKIAATATIEPPAIIGNNTEIRPGAYLRGQVIVGDGCVVGNSTELKHCVLLDAVQAPHYNYVGDSVLGFHAHLGAGVICSNLKADGKPVVIHGDEDYPTGLRKVGAFLGDGADIGCNSVLNPGTVVGQNSSVYPLTPLRGVIGANCIVKNAQTVVPRK